MSPSWRRAVSLVNGRVLTADGIASSVRFRRRVLGLDDPPGTRDTVVDLEGAWVLPGLVNAHDHLELNHYGAWPGHGHYENASDWIREVGAALESDPEARQRRAWPLAQRLFAGALKNLLAGVTTVAHHNPFYREIRVRFPVRVVRRYGWAHSFALQNGRAGANGEPAGDVSSRHRRTRSTEPFMLHLGEGIDAAARDELDRLDALGCLTPNTVIVHGVALTEDDFARLAQRGAALVWCPASNLAMFGRTAAIGRWRRGGLDTTNVSIGTDSRLTGSRDLLEECKTAARAEPGLRDGVLPMVTSAAGRALRLAHAGCLTIGAPADLIVLPRCADAASALLGHSRREVMLVVIDGRPRIGSAAFRAVFAARGVKCEPMALDGAPKIASGRLMAQVEALPECEPGVELLTCASRS